MKKILFVHHAIGWGGAPTNMVEIIKSLDKKYYHAKVLLLKDSVVSERLRKEGIEYSVASSVFYKKFYKYFGHTEPGHVKFYEVFKFLIKALSWIFSRYYFADKELKKHEFDLVHLNSSVLTDWLAPAKKIGKVAIHIQEPFRKGSFDLLHYFFKAQMSKYADSIIAISKDNADRIGLKQKTTVIYNYFGIPTKEPNLDSYSSKLFLYLGGAAYIKGFYTLVNALDYLEDDVKIYFAGYYHFESKAHNLLEKLIDFVFGYKNRRAINKMRNHPNAIEIGLINNIDYYLNNVCGLISPFSISHFSRPVIEAHLFKKPVIGSDVKGMEEIINHNINGIIIPKNNPKELANAINSLASDSKRAQMLGENGYKIAITKFSPENIKMFESLYNKLLDDN